LTTVNISLPDSLREYVESRVAEGSYSSATDYFLELVRRDQQQEQQRLEGLLLEGLASGEAVEMTEQDWAQIRERVAQRLAERKQG